MNQGILMRFLSARSVGDARKAAATVLLLLMPLAAVAVSGAGWIGRALVARGALAADTEAGDIFVTVADRILPVGLFGLVVAALVAALMSTADTLINAIATISVNDLWRPLRTLAGRPPGERATLRAARLASAAATIMGFALVPVFASFGSIYRAHGAFTAAITPPLAVALVLGFCWRRFSPRAALLVMVGGSLLIALSLRWPEMVAPLAHGIDLEAGGKGYSYIRALFGLVVCGLVVCGAIGAIGALLWPDRREVPGTLRLGPVVEKMRAFKRGEPRPGRAASRRFRLALLEEEPGAGPEASRPRLRLAAAQAARLGLEEGDLATLREDHWLRGGYQGFTGRVELDEGPADELRVPAGDLSGVRLRDGCGVVVRRLL
jgi:SSS family solute:Na+ symporter